MNHQKIEQKMIKSGCALMVYKYHLDALPNLFRDMVCSELDISAATFYRRIRQGHLINIAENSEKTIKPPFNKAEDNAINIIFKKVATELYSYAESTNLKDTESPTNQAI